MSADSRLAQDRVVGVMLGAAAGDALGWPQELRSSIVGGQKVKDGLSPQPHYRAWERYSGNRFTGRYVDPVGAGEYSDDTQLLSAVARCLLSGDRWFDRLVQQELPTWRIYQRGGGGAVLRAASAWAESRAPWLSGTTARQRDGVAQYRRAGANGVAMRIAPHVIWTIDVSEDDLRRHVVADGVTTHGHPRALLGALLYAGTLRAALASRETMPFGGLVEAARHALIDDEAAVELLPADWGDHAELAEFKDAWRRAVIECSDMLNLVEQSLSRGAMSDPEEVLKDLGCIDSPISGAGTVTALGSVYLASRAAARPLSGLLNAAFLRKADTDTLASMTGALLGALHGTQWLGGLAQVQDAQYLAHLGSALAAKSIQESASSIDVARSSSGDLFAELLDVNPGAVGVFPDGRKYRLTERSPLDDGKRQRAALVLEDGQTVFVDVKVPERLQRAAPKSSEPRFTEAAPSQRSTSDRPSVAPAVSVGVQVNLLTANVNKTAAFYARLLGREVDVLPQRRLRVADSLVFHETDGNQLQGADQSLITLRVADLREAGRLLDAEIVHGPDGREIRGRDPDGRWVQILQVAK